MEAQHSIVFFIQIVQLKGPGYFSIHKIVWFFMPLISVLGRLRQEDPAGFKASLEQYM